MLRYGAFILTFCFTIIALIVFFSHPNIRLSANSSRVCYQTWESQGDIPGSFNVIELESNLAVGAKPWAGTVSHHLLAHEQINTWFQELSLRRDVRTFFILSPSHWGLSTQAWSLTDGTWLTATGEVESDLPKVIQISRALDVPLEPGVFVNEHGVSTLIPYIGTYFPKAKIVAICYQGEPPLNQRIAQLLTDVLLPFFVEENRNDNFLLLSADFAHHGDPEGTLLKDNRTRMFFNAPGKDTWIFAGCDNRPGIYVLSRMLTPESHCTILYHTDSWRLSGQDSHDITSYFFTFFSDTR
jgi:hypothetical protein